jgi:hypothetical protein
MHHLYLTTLLCLLVCLPQSLSATVVVPARDTFPDGTFRAAPISPEDFYEMDQQELEQRLGRELTRREKRMFRKAKRRAGDLVTNYAQGEYRPGNGFAIAGFVLGVVSILTLGIFGWITGPLALIFSILGLGRSNRLDARHRGLAIAGIVMGGLTILLFLVVLGVVLIAFTL